MHKLLLMSVLGLGIGIGASQAADVVVKVGPAARDCRAPERAPESGAMYGLPVIIAGMATPMSGSPDAGRSHTTGTCAVWVAPRWEHRSGGYVFVEGRWR